MKCSQIRIYLKEYHHGSLDAELAGQITAHVASCDDCAKELAFLQSYLHSVKKIPVQKAPSQLAANVIQKIALSKDTVSRDATPFWKRFQPLPVPVTALAGMLLVIIFGYAAYHSLSLFPKNQDKNLAERDGASYAAPIKTKEEDAGVPNLSAGQRKSTATSLQAVADGAGKASRIGPLPVLTLILSTAVSADKKEAALQAAPDSSRLLNKSTAYETSSEPNDSSRNTESVPPSQNPVMEKLQALIRKCGGQYTLPTESPGTKTVPELIVTLPANHYRNFLAGIREYGEVKQPAGNIGAKDGEMVTIKLEVLSSP
jgi:hypothetical protein